MILLCGIPSETPIDLVRNRLDELDAPYVTFNQRRFRDAAIGLEIEDAEVNGVLRNEDGTHPLKDFDGVYTRLMDYQRLPELRDQPAASADRQRCRVLHETRRRPDADTRAGIHWAVVRSLQTVLTKGFRVGHHAGRHRRRLRTPDARIGGGLPALGARHR